MSTPRGNRQRATSLAVALSLLLPSIASADTSNQFWPELYLYLRVAPRMQLIGEFAGSVTFDGSYRGVTGSVYFDYRFTDAASAPSLRVGYTYSQDRALYEDVSHGSTLDVAGTFRLPVGSKWLLTDRNRLDLVANTSVVYLRYRNRLRFEGYVPTSCGSEFLLYTSVEVFTDSRYMAVSKLVAQLGAEFSLSKEVALELYYSATLQRFTEPSLINAIGMTINLYYSL